jgi:hypothetical protein
MKEIYEREVMVGQWFYDNIIPKIVKIFALNYDYNYEIAKADDQLEELEKPELNENGEMFMIKWGNGSFSDKDLVTKEYGGLDLNSAINKAENIVHGKIEWKTK